MPEQRPFLERLVFGKQHSPRVEREEKVLPYPLHRMNADAKLYGVLQVLPAMVEELRVHDGFVDLAMGAVVTQVGLLEHVFVSGELDPKRRR